MKNRVKTLKIFKQLLPLFPNMIIFLWEYEKNWSDHLRKVLTSNSAKIVYAAKSLQSCPTLCDPIDGSPPGSAVPGIPQARTLEWVAISFSNAWKWKVKMKSLSCVWVLATTWTAAYQAPRSMGFSRQEYWSRVPLPSLKIVYSKCFILDFVFRYHLTFKYF